MTTLTTEMVVVSTVPERGPSEDVDRVARSLRALANHVRMTLLRELRSPKTITEIRVDGNETGRPLARQTVKEHVDRLVEAGFVVAQESTRPYGKTIEYSLNHQSVYLLLEAVRDVAVHRPEREPTGDTMPAGASPPEVGVAGPGLVVVKGLAEGYSFPLVPPADGSPAEWTIGRRRGLPVSLDFDPCVSAENSLVRWESGVYTLEGLPESRNGTFVNFRSLQPGQPRELRHGDIIGVGRSLLTFHE